MFLRHVDLRVRATAALLLLVSLDVCADQIKYKLTLRSVVESRLQRYAGNNKQREATLKAMFGEVGCTENLVEQPVRESRLPNVICTLPGTTDQVIIVGAHYDRAEDGDGVVDNWSGASLLPSLYQALNGQPRKHTYVFIGFTDEEKGEIGSHFYAKEFMTKEQIAATDAMVNMDTLGLGVTEVWASTADKRLLEKLIRIAMAQNVPISGMNVDGVGSTDSVQFADRKIPSITLHSINQQTWNAHILHTSKDKYSAINLDEYYRSYQLIAMYIAYLDQSSREAPSGPPTK
jgi:peptidase M28-like protein